MVDWTYRDITPEEERAIANFMARLAGGMPPGSAARLPVADVVWLKAQLLRRWEAERKVQAPLDLMEPVQIAAGLVAAALLLMWSLPSLVQSLSWLGI